tara:strand:- start:322 stop:543 length:222 start_codon:yes stop_codon:yes gene_type:complete
VLESVKTLSTNKIRLLVDNINETNINTMSNLEKLYKIQELINKPFYAISTKEDRLKLNEYVQTLIKIEKEYDE